jgi:hypothetical protein
MQASVKDFLPSHNLLLHIFFDWELGIGDWGLGTGDWGRITIAYCLLPIAYCLLPFSKH